MTPYHSALTSPGKYPPATRWDGRGSTAFVAPFGAEPKLHPAFRAADVLYCDPPWDAGYAEFNRRAGTSGMSNWASFMRRFDAAIHALGKPAVIVLGVRGLKQLTPDDAVACRLNGGKAMAAIYGMPRGTIGDGLEAEQIIARLTAVPHLNVVGDPMCGYGRAGRVFAAAGKRFVMADSNPECIGFIAAHAEGWHL